jgi:hypothetical protein
MTRVAVRGWAVVWSVIRGERHVAVIPLTAEQPIRCDTTPSAYLPAAPGTWAEYSADGRLVRVVDEPDGGAS